MLINFVQIVVDESGYQILFSSDPHVIRRDPRVCAINSAMEVDLTGKICADSIGMYQYSGVGGQMDFMRGAAFSGPMLIILLQNMASPVYMVKI